MNQSQNCDVLVIGGGIVGATAASLLGRCGYSVLLVEAGEAAQFDASREIGNRVSAISPGSAAVLREAGAWGAVEAQRHRPYQRMQVEDADSGAQLTFEAPALGLASLGTIVENDLLCAALWRELEALETVSLRTNARLAEVLSRGGAVGDEPARCRLSDGAEVGAQLVLGCDGPGSKLRQIMGVGTAAWDYNQRGVTCVVRKEQPNPGVAWQRFAANGTLAFLPLHDGRSSIVWSVSVPRADQLLAMDDAEFAAELAEASEGWLGEVQQVGARAAFPLTMRLNDRYVAGPLVLLGDAAHVVHPLAGQGVNLGLADVAALLETMLHGRSQRPGILTAGELRDFERWRRSESGLMAWGVHGIGGLFRQDVLAPLRGLGMRLVERSWLTKSTFVQRAAGQGPNAPRLARGEQLQSLQT